MNSVPVSQCFMEILPNPALLTGLHEQGIQVLPKPGERRCWVPLGSLLTADQQREWSFLLECWCLYEDLEMRPWHQPVPAQTDTGLCGSAEAQGVEVALTPAQILEFVDWTISLSRHEKPGDTLVASHLLRLRAFLADDVDAASPIRVIASASRVL